MNIYLHYPRHGFGFAGPGALKRSPVVIRTSIILISCCLSFFTSCTSEESALYHRIRTAVDKIWLIDTHEHFMPESGRLKTEGDFFSLVIGYLQADMLSSGMTDDELAIMLDTK